MAAEDNDRSSPEHEQKPDDRSGESLSVDEEKASPAESHQQMRSPQRLLAMDPDHLLMEGRRHGYRFWGLGCCSLTHGVS